MKRLRKYEVGKLIYVKNNGVSHLDYYTMLKVYSNYNWRNNRYFNFEPGLYIIENNFAGFLMIHCPHKSFVHWKNVEIVC